METTVSPDLRPRQYYQTIRALPEAERAAALAAVPDDFRTWVARYLALPEDEFTDAQWAIRYLRAPLPLRGNRYREIPPARRRAVGHVIRQLRDRYRHASGATPWKNRR